MNALSTLVCGKILTCADLKIKGNTHMYLSTLNSGFLCSVGIYPEDCTLKPLQTQT
jgi:hypothetical membrane protein